MAGESTDASVSVGVDTKDAERNLKRLGDEVDSTGQKFSKFDSILGATFGTKNVFHVTNFNRALTSLKETAETTALVLTTLNVAIAGFMNAVVKELNKLQGFLSVMALSTKSTEMAASQFEFLRVTASRLGIDINALLVNYSKLLAAFPDGNEKFSTAQKVFIGLAMAARTLHASTLDTQLMFYAVTQMASKGVLSMEELRRQLGERLPGAMEIAARAGNTTSAELEKAIRTGTVQSIPFLKNFGDELIRTFAGSAEIASNTVDAAFNRLKNVWIDFTKAVLDSGAGQAIIAVFDALRQKLSDPEIMRMFADTIGRLSKSVADFIKNLTAQDMLNAFTALETGITAVVKVTLKLLEAMTWIIEHSKEVGAVLGALFGAAKGAAIGALFGGPVGAGIGAGIGAAAGGILGYAGGAAIAPTQEEKNQRYRDSVKATEEAAARAQQKEFLSANVYPDFFSRNFRFSERDLAALMPMIEKNLGVTIDTLAKFGQIVADPKFKNLQEKQAAALTLASTGQLLGPRGELKDWLGPAKPEKEKHIPVLHPKDELKEGEQYIAMLERQRDTVEHLTEVDKLWAAVTEGRVHFFSEENFLRAKAIAEQIDQSKIENQLVKSGEAMRVSAQKYSDVLREQIESIGLTEPEQKKVAALKQFDESMRNVIDKSAPEFRRQLQDLAKILRSHFIEELDNANATLTSFKTGLFNAFAGWKTVVEDNAKTAETLFNTAMKGMEDAFVQFVNTGKLSFRSLVDSMIAELARIAFRKNVLGFLETTGLDKYFKPEGKAIGGSVMANQVVMVGEQGPELFVSSTPGRIVPNSQLQAGGSGISFHFNTTLNVGADVSRAELNSALAQNRQITIAQITDMARRKQLPVVSSGA